MKLIPCPLCGNYPTVREGIDPPYFVMIECSCGLNLTVWKKEEGSYEEPSSNVPKRYIRDLWNLKSRVGSGNLLCKIPKDLEIKSGLKKGTFWVSDKIQKMIDDEELSEM